MAYSLKQAAEATGKQKSTIQRAIKSGRISATLTETGAYQIDPAELHRIFPPVSRTEAQPVAEQQNATAELESENRELRAKVGLLREMVDDLRGRLDQEADERRRLTLLLTHQPPPAPANQNTPPTVRPALWVALAAASTAAALWYVWPWLTPKN